MFFISRWEIDSRGPLMGTGAPRQGLSKGVRPPRQERGQSPKDFPGNGKRWKRRGPSRGLENPTKPTQQIYIYIKKRVRRPPASSN